MVGPPLLLWTDLLTARALVWIVSVGRDGDLTDQAHLFFCDRYGRLAQHYREHGRRDRARRYQQKADEHWVPGGDGPPYAAAMAMPRPSRFFRTNATSGSGRHHPDDAA
jgi:hypothetical protein